MAGAGGLVAHIGATSPGHRYTAYGNPLDLWEEFRDFLCASPSVLPRSFQGYILPLAEKITALRYGRDPLSGHEVPADLDVQVYERLVFQILGFCEPKKPNAFKRARSASADMSAGFAEKYQDRPNPSSQVDGRRLGARQAQRRRKRGQAGWKA